MQDPSDVGDGQREVVGESEEDEATADSDRDGRAQGGGTRRVVHRQLVRLVSQVRIVRLVSQVRVVRLVSQIRP